jgi:hypothetical protein
MKHVIRERKEKGNAKKRKRERKRKRKREEKRQKKRTLWTKCCNCEP